MYLRSFAQPRLGPLDELTILGTEIYSEGLSQAVSVRRCWFNTFEGQNDKPRILNWKRVSLVTRCLRASFLLNALALDLPSFCFQTQALVADGSQCVGWWESDSPWKRTTRWEFVCHLCNWLKCLTFFDVLNFKKIRWTRWGLCVSKLSGAEQCSPAACWTIGTHRKYNE